MPVSVKGPGHPHDTVCGEHVCLCVCVCCPRPRPQDTQNSKSNSKLSERNIVELVNKLKALGILGDDLLHTMNGREYITTARLRSDIQQALAHAGGRLPLVELPPLIGVDLVHCERQAAVIVAEGKGQVGGWADLRSLDALNPRSSTPGPAPLHPPPSPPPPHTPLPPPPPSPPAPPPSGPGGTG